MRSRRSCSRVCLRRGIITSRSGVGPIEGGLRQLAGGLGQRRKHARAMGFGGVDVPGRGGENHCAVRHLLVCPAAEPGVERLDQMMSAAVMLQIRGMGHTHRIGHGVVDVAFLHWSVAAGPAARQITPPNEVRCRRRRSIPRIRRRVRAHLQRLQLRSRGQLAYRLSRQDPKAGQITGLITGPIDGGLFGQYVDDGGSRCWPRCCARWPRRSHPTRTGRRAWPHPAPAARRHRPSLLFSARIVAAHRGGQGVETLIERGTVSGVEVARDRGHARASRGDVHVAVVINLRRHPHPGRIELHPPQIHPIPQLRARSIIHFSA